MEEIKQAPKKESAERGKSAASDLTAELETFRADYHKSTEQACTDATSAIERIWHHYWDTIADIIRKAERTWIDSYQAYLDAYKGMPRHPDHDAMDAIRDAWSAHIDACTWSPDLIKAWNAANEKLIAELQKVEESVGKAFRESAERYSKGLHGSFKTHGLDNLDLPALEFVAQRLSVINAISAG
jgi:hypothetical protein